MQHSEPYPFQKVGVRRIHESWGRHLLVDDLGLGKTFQALLYGWKYLADEPGPMVAVVPAHLKLNWVREAEQHLGEHIEILSHQRVPAGKPPPWNPQQIYAINYDILVPRRWSPSKPLPPDSWAAWLAALNPRYVIADEAAKLRNQDNKCCRAFRRMVQNVPHVVLLTGTPLTNEVMDLWPLLNIVRPDLYPSRWEFGMTYTKAYKAPWGWEFPGAKNLDVLHHNLVNVQRIMTRRRKVDVAKELPPIRREIVPLEIPMTEYREAENDFLNWLTKINSAAAMRAAQAEALSRVNYLRRLVGILKVPAAVEWVRGFFAEGGGKLLLGATHKKVTHAVIGEFGPRAVLVDGGLTAEEKQARTDAFNSDPAVDLMVGNTQSAGTGWNCTCTSDAAVAELPWSGAEAEQFWGRIYGLNRGLPGIPCHVRYLIAPDTIDEDICGIISRKMQHADAVVDGIFANGDMSDSLTEAVRSMRARHNLEPSKCGS